ncbi:PREDICTED: uncharacterized protein LOC104588200 [Nelumbo nucifera]|uniref:Uncharacterized protein LOC104588200 n=1 Tax=Nelumbo nucifera TaxID=4432 RepID=A0A1U7YV81_NELNU|nr:PREDICTED: uncharacterized protein LOC104588200 [Nelumbo nucifera]
MLILRTCVSPLQQPKLLSCNFSRQTHFSAPLRPFAATLLLSRRFLKSSVTFAKASRSEGTKTRKLQKEIEEDGEDDDNDEEEEEVSAQARFRGREEEKDYDRDPELAEILGSCFDDPQKAKARVEDRIRNKRNKILHPKTGSAIPMKVTFNKFDFSNSYIWFEFYNAPLPNDISLICDAIRAWHIIGRLGGCNSMNMQLSQAPLDKRPNYDAIQGANVTPTTFYNIGDFEIQENLARIWVDIGTSEPLLLDVLINALTQISSDYIGIKQVAFGGSEFESWKEDLASEDAGCSVHKI